MDERTDGQTEAFENLHVDTSGGNCDRVTVVGYVDMPAGSDWFRIRTTTN